MKAPIGEGEEVAVGVLAVKEEVFGDVQRHAGEAGGQAGEAEAPGEEERREDHGRGVEQVDRPGPFPAEIGARPDLRLGEPFDELGPGVEGEDRHVRQDGADHDRQRGPGTVLAAQDPEVEDRVRRGVHPSEADRRNCAVSG